MKSGGIWGAVSWVVVEEGGVLPLRVNIMRPESVISQGRLKPLRGWEGVLVSSSLFSIHAETPLIILFHQVLFP